MKFEERNAKRYNLKENKSQSLIYFLIRNEEVVYVGQTNQGICRPLSHKDKQFDCFYTKRCSPKMLDKREREMILKYKPIYNKNYKNDNNLVSITKIKNDLFSEGREVRRAFFDKIVKDLHIEPIIFGMNTSFTIKDAKLIYKYCKNNYKDISREQKKSLIQKIGTSNDELFLRYLAICKGMSYKTMRDMIYLGFISNKEIAQEIENFEKNKNNIKI